MTNDRHEFLAYAELLEAALDEQHIDRRSYGFRFDGIRVIGHDMMCLSGPHDGKWDVYYTERGCDTSVCSCESIREAIRIFYWKLTNAPDPWMNKQRWQKIMHKHGL